MEENDVSKADLMAFELAQEQAVRNNVVCTYIIRAIHNCVNAGLLHEVQRSRAIVTEKGQINCGKIDVSEDELREQFVRLTSMGHVHESLEFEDVFNGVVSKGEVIH